MRLRYEFTEEDGSKRVERIVQRVLEPAADYLVESDGRMYRRTYPPGPHFSLSVQYTFHSQAHATIAEEDNESVRKEQAETLRESADATQHDERE